MSAPMKLHNTERVFFRNKASARFKLFIRGTRNKIFDFKKNTRPSLIDSVTYENQYIKLADATEPLWRRPYESQLQLKQYLVGKCLRRVFNILTHEKNLKVADHVFLQRMETDFDKKICHLEDTIPSPLVRGYRNKDTVNFGPDIRGNKRTLGLYIGRAYNKSLICIQPFFLNILKEHHKELSKLTQEFVNNSSYETKFQMEREGNWKSVVTRSTTTGEMMLIFHFHPQNNCHEFVNGAKEEIIQFYVHGPGKHLRIDSIYFQSHWKKVASHEDAPYELLHGIPVITETLLDLQFQISPTSFFQGNTQCAEILYSKALELGKVDSKTTVLDVCCGTGTIGLIAARKAKHVIGVDITPQAIDDANLNAKRNSILNANFVCNKAHRALKEIVKNDHLDNNVVAILNPGSSGVNKELIKSIRNCEKIKKVIYISCKPVGNVLKNFSHLILPVSDDLYGKQFVPIVAVPVDMFPQTLHCELLVLFER